MSKYPLLTLAAVLAVALGGCAYNAKICENPNFNWLCVNPPQLKQPPGPTIPLPLLTLHKVTCDRYRFDQTMLVVTASVRNDGTRNLPVDPQQILYDNSGNPHSVSFAVTVTTQTVSGNVQSMSNGWPDTLSTSADEAIPIGPFAGPLTDIAKVTATVSMTGGAAYFGPDLVWQATAQQPGVESNGNVNCQVGQ